MKLKSLNLGKSLSREELKQIKGGQGPCAVGSGVTDCVCTNSRTICYPGDGIHTPQELCNNWCMSSYGVTGSASACVVGACQP